MKRISPEEIADAKASVVMSEYRNLKDMAEAVDIAVAQAQLDSCEKEHKEKVREIFEEIGRHFKSRGYRDMGELEWYQALKQEILGVNDES